VSVSYKVVSPCVLAKDPQGRVFHRYEGAVIDWLSDEQAEHFLAEGLVTEDGADDDAKPKKTAPKADWVEHAVADGYDRDEVESMTKADLVALFD